MLKGSKSVTLTYQSIINGVPAIYMTASIPESGKSTVNKNITNLDIYEANKEECRKDMGAFDEILWGMEDQSVEMENGSTETTTGEVEEDDPALGVSDSTIEDTFGGMSI